MIDERALDERLTALEAGARAGGRMIDRSPRTPELHRSPRTEFREKGICLGG
jgi:hypothetical protein